MINANEIRNKAREEFNKTFDFKSFDDYINKHIAPGKTLYIGLTYKNQNLGSLSFGCRQCGYWTTDIQVSHEVESFVYKYLIDAGFKLSKKGVAGFDDCDVILVSL